ncbi:SDR family oxidoreductase [Nitrospirillum pindoramense]|uniref:NAD(P)-dependent dehydrogenase (Short-subunit alcohol dehydrogenase family) n=1 Tax=Nitrospirillum amazonense TaxID=28077 RepID=A0A560HC79_9PROT|nr:SDR family oxidoreductase [Nitrospirillum amazonense]TWB43968.1 NAD(P)-dependent dehydrogenase (short-subunit alcohol dehydrogenase family) [Nitrospirillum amazonense]
MKLDLNERVAIVTGGSSGIGRAVAKVLAQQGTKVVITARRGDRLNTAAAELEAETAGTVMPIPSDTTDQERVDGMVAAVMAAFDRIDILVNCAASPSSPAQGEILHLDGNALLGDLDTKVVGYARCAKAVAPHMVKRRWGRIINIGGLTGRSSNLLSGMRNVAVCHLTKTLSDQLGPDGVTVNALHPGVTQTEHIVELFETEAAKRGVSPAEIEAEFSAATPIRRVIRAEEVGYAVAFLASPLAAAITGESLAVDGGITRGIYL